MGARSRAVTTEPEALPSRSGDALQSAPAEIPAMRRFAWLLRRELWESRSLYLAPLAVTGVLLLGAVIGAFHLPAKMREVAGLAPSARQEALTDPYMKASLLLMATTFVVSLFYCADALQSERRDRSILFWKSLPVSDRATVLSKAAVPFAILPLLTVGLAAIAHTAMLLLSSAALMANGQGPGMLWAHVSLPEMWLMLLYHMVTVHALWYAPIYGWLLLVSAWARRAPWLWAVLPPLAIGIVERIAFGSSVLGELLADRFGGGPGGTEFTVASRMMDPLMQMTPGTLLASAGLWLGLVAAAGCVSGAVWFRRRREPV
jgi:ABC-2 type transport system permease protein